MWACNILKPKIFVGPKKNLAKAAAAVASPFKLHVISDLHRLVLQSRKSFSFSHCRFVLEVSGNNYLSPFHVSTLAKSLEFCCPVKNTYSPSLEALFWKKKKEYFQLTAIQKTKHRLFTIIRNFGFDVMFLFLWINTLQSVQSTQ